MASRLVIALVVVVAAVVAARLLERRRPAPPTRDAYPVPAQLDRQDFPRPDAPWLFVLFSSRTCDSCGPMVARVCGLESDAVATVQVEAKADKALHDRYRIEGVPMVVLADAAREAARELMAGVAAGPPAEDDPSGPYRVETLEEAAANAADTPAVEPADSVFQPPEETPIPDRRFGILPRRDR